MANKEFGDWNPMEEAYKNPEFNSYLEGPGAKLDQGGLVRSTRPNDRRAHKLHFSNVPLGMTTNGLKNAIREWAEPKSVFIYQGTRQQGFTWAIVEFGTFGDAEVTMRGCNEKPPYNFVVKFARNQEEKDRSMTGDRNNHKRDQPFQLDRENNDRSIRMSNRGNQPLPGVAQNSPSSGGGTSQTSAVNTSPPRPKNVNTDTQQPNNVNSSPQQYSNSEDSASGTLEATTGPCGLCQKITSGKCGACSRVWYCTQSCARKHFYTHVPQCRIPVPAICFDGNEDTLDESPVVPKNIASPIANCNDSATFSSGNHLANASSDCTEESSAVVQSKSEELKGNGHSFLRKPRTNDSNNFNRSGGNNNNNMQRKSYGSKAADKEDDSVTKTPNRFSSFTPPTKHGSDEKKPFNNTKKKIWIQNEDLDAQSVWQVKVTDINPRFVTVLKTENEEDVNKMTEKLTANAMQFPPHDPQETWFCSAVFLGSWYRAKIVKGTTGPDRIKYIDYGNMEPAKPEHIKSLPEEYTTLPAQGIKIQLQDSTSDQLKCNSVIFIQTISKPDSNIWLVKIVQQGNPSSPSGQQSMSVATQPQKALSPNMSPFPRNKQSPGANQAMTSFPSDIPSLDSYTLVVVTVITQTASFWATRKSNTEEVEDMIMKLNMQLAENPSPYPGHLEVGDLVAVYREDGWYRAKVLRSEPVLKVGLIDYGHTVDPSPDEIKSLPTEFKSMPGQAMKFKSIEGNSTLTLSVESQIEVKPKSLEKVNGCYLVDIKSPSASADYHVQKVAEKKVTASDSTVTIPPVNTTALNVPSFHAEKLPTGKFTEVDIVISDKTGLWVNIKAHFNAIDALVLKLFSFCKASHSPCQPKVGAIVAALFEGAWFRAEVLSIAPKIRVYFLDYGNESDVGANDIIFLPEDFLLQPAQAIKISFPKNTSAKYLGLEHGSLSIKPVTGEKCLDGSILVEVEGDSAAQVTQEPPSQTPTVVKDAPVVLRSPVPAALKSPQPAPLKSPQRTPLQSPQPVIQLSPVSAISKEPLLTLKPFELPEGQYTEVSGLVRQGWVTFPINVEPLYQMMVSLHQQLQASGFVVQPEVGNYVSCKFDGFWHRANILSKTSTHARVMYVDYAEEADVPLDEIYILPPEFHEMPIQAIKITFVEGTPEKYNRLAETQVLRVKPLRKQADGSVVVQVEGVNTVAEKSSMEIAPVAVSASPSTGQSPSVGSQDLSCKIVQRLPSDNVTEVVVTASAENELWVTVVAKASELDTMMAILNLKGTSLPPCPNAPQVGDFVSVLFDPLNMWHRGKVLSVVPNYVEVRFIDYGSVEKSSVDKLKALPEEFMKLPSQGIKIQLCAGAPAKYQHPNIDDILHVRLITELVDGTAVVSVVEK